MWSSGVLFVLTGPVLRAQTHVFTNLDFESARIPSGAQPGSSVPMGMAFPGWSMGGQSNGFPIVKLDVSYDSSFSTYNVSIYDSHATDGIVPLQGNYSAVVVTGGSQPLSMELSETGMIPIGTKSVLVEAASSLPGVPLKIEVAAFPSGSGPFPAIMAVPLQTTPTYTVYGCDVSAFAGLTSSITLDFGSGPGDPLDKIEVDDVMFSPNAIPEPGTGSLLITGSVLLWAAVRTKII